MTIDEPVSNIIQRLSVLVAQVRCLLLQAQRHDLDDLSQLLESDIEASEIEVEQLAKEIQRAWVTAALNQAKKQARPPVPAVTNPAELKIAAHTGRPPKAPHGGAHRRGDVVANRTCERSGCTRKAVPGARHCHPCGRGIAA